MLLKEFSPKTVKTSTQSNLPAIRFTAAGPIYLNKKAIEFLNGVPKKGITLFQDSVKPKDWYFKLDESGFQLHPYKKEGDVLYFTCKSLVNIVRESIETKKKAFGLRILEKTVVEGIPVHPLLTSITI